MLNTTIWVLLLCVVLFPICLTISFSIPLADDYSTACDVVNMDGNLLINAIDLTNQKYLNWAGGWPFNLPQIILNPLVIAPTKLIFYGVELCIFFIIFVIVFYLYIKVILKYIFRELSVNKIRYYFLLILFVFLNTNIYEDVFYWFVGNSYLWEVIFCFLNQIFIVLYFRRENSIKYTICLYIFGFIACFAYQLAVLSGFLYLFEVYNYYKMSGNKIGIKLIPLYVMIIAGLISCMAPGNFARHQVEASNSSIILPSSMIVLIGKGMIFALQNQITCSFKLFSQPLVLVTIFISVIFGFKNSKKLGNIHPLILLISEFVAIFLICFTFALGYSSTILPNRADFIINISLLLFTCFNMCYLSNYINHKYKLRKFFSKYEIPIMCTTGLFILISLFQFTNTGEFYLYRLPWVDTASKIVLCYQESCISKDAINYIANSSDLDVVVDGDKYSVVDNYNNYSGNIGPTTHIMRKFILTTDKDYWINKDIARYYHKNSVIAVFNETKDKYDKH